MWTKKLRLTFYSLSLSLLASCGEGFSVQNINDSFTGSTTPSSSLCPEPLVPASNNLNNFKASTNLQKNWISQKIQISPDLQQNSDSQISLSVQIDKECSSFLKSSSLSQSIPHQSSTLDIPSLQKQSYSHSLAKKDLASFSQKAEQDYCIKTVSLNSTFSLIKHIQTKKVTLEETLTTSVQQKIATPRETFNDPFLLRQTHLWAISAFDAFTEFYNDTYGLSATDLPSIVAIVDTPIDRDHEDFLANTVLNTLDIAPISYSINTDHGTHIAGLIAANRNNNLGTIGLASSSVKLISVGVVNSSGSITVSNLENKLNEIYGLSPDLQPQVINLSLEIDTINCQDRVNLSASIKALLDSGISIVVAAGNGIEQADGTSQGQEFGPGFLKYPACLSRQPGYEGLISVGSVDISGNSTIGGKSEFSNYGFNYIDIAAPGGSSLGGLYSTVSSPKKYKWLTGTSMSTPLVTSAVALTYSVLNKTRVQIGNQSIFTQCAVSQADKARLVKNLILQSATKESRFSTFWKDGNVLNLNGLIQHIQLLFPNSKKN